MVDRLCEHSGAPIRVALAIAAMMICVVAIARADIDPFTQVLRRAHEYVVIYEDHELSTVVARERYEQQWLDAQGQTKMARTLLSDYLLFQLPPSEDWFALRDVQEVDGTPIDDRTARLNDLFGRPRDVQHNLAMEIMKESARFNLAPDLYYRTVNVPTFALRFLRPASRARMTFAKAGEETIDGTPCWVIGFQENKGPTYVATPDRHDLHAQGRFWVEPDSGAVLRSEMIVGGTRRTTGRVTITVTYRRDPALAFRVPIEMVERYDNPRHLEDDVVVARATYSEFRPFDWHTLVPRTNP